MTKKDEVIAKILADAYGFGTGKPDLARFREDLEATRSNFIGAALGGVCLRRAPLEGANFSESLLIGANLEGAALAGAKFGHANLGGANLKGANLVKAFLNEADLSEARLDGADLEGAQFVFAELAKATLVGANLADANFEGAVLKGADLRNAELEHAVLKGADLTDADLRGAQIWGARMWGAVIKGVKITEGQALALAISAKLIDSEAGRKMQMADLTRLLEEKGVKIERVAVPAAQPTEQKKLVPQKVG